MAIVFDTRQAVRRSHCLLICARDPEPDLVVRVVEAMRRELDGDLILVDDGSRDRAYTDRLRPHIDVLIALPEAVGTPGAANAGLDFCIRSGYDICFRCDADDLTLPGRAEETLALFARHPDCILVAGMANDIGVDGALIRVYGTPGWFARGDDRFLYPISPARHSTFAIHLMRTGGRLRYDESYSLSQDYCLLFDAIAIGSVAISARPFIDYTTGPATISYRRRRAQLLFRARLCLSRGNWRSPRPYATLMLLAASALLPEATRNMAGRILSALLRKIRR